MSSFATVGSALLALTPGPGPGRRATRATRCRRRPYRCPARISRYRRAEMRAVVPRRKERNDIEVLRSSSRVRFFRRARRRTDRPPSRNCPRSTARRSGSPICEARWCWSTLGQLVYPLQSVVPGPGWSPSRAARSRSRSAGRQRRRTAARRGRVSRRANAGDDGSVRSAGRDAVGLQRSRHAELRGDRSRRANIRFTHEGRTRHSKATVVRSRRSRRSDGYDTLVFSLIRLRRRRGEARRLRHRSTVTA